MCIYFELKRYLVGELAKTVFVFVFFFDLIHFIADGLVKKLDELEKVADTYKGLIDHTKKLLKATFELSQSHKGIHSEIVFDSMYDESVFNRHRVRLEWDISVLNTVYLIHIL